MYNERDSHTTVPFIMRYIISCNIVPGRVTVHSIFRFYSLFYQIGYFIFFKAYVGAWLGFIQHADIFIVYLR